MSAVFRIILIAASLGTCVYISRKLKNAQVNTHDTIFWILFSLILIVISLFPGIADWIAVQMGIYSTVNMVFMIIIFALLLRVFQLTIKTSQMEHRVHILVEELAIRDKKDDVSGPKKKWERPMITVYYLNDKSEEPSAGDADGGLKIG